MIVEMILRIKCDYQSSNWYMSKTTNSIEMVKNETRENWKIKKKKDCLQNIHFESMGLTIFTTINYANCSDVCH